MERCRAASGCPLLHDGSLASRATIKGPTRKNFRAVILGAIRAYFHGIPSLFRIPRLNFARNVAPASFSVTVSRILCLARRRAAFSSFAVLAIAKPWLRGFLGSFEDYCWWHCTPGCVGPRASPATGQVHIKLSPQLPEGWQC